MVIWILGISGSGKTTLGKMLYSYLKEKNFKCALIDGDIVRKFFDNDLGYSVKDRIENFKRIVFAAYMLEKNDILTIVCAITPLQLMRDFARKKLNKYIEIYLHRDIDEIKNSGIKKELYENALNIVGVDIEFEIPSNCDLIIKTGVEPPEKSFEKLKKFINKYIP